MILKDILNKTYKTKIVDEIVKHHTDRMREIGDIKLPNGRIAMCALKPLPQSETLIVPDGTVDSEIYEYGTIEMGSSMFIVQVPVYGGVPLGGSQFVRSVLVSEIYCYWSMDSVKRLLK